MSYWLVTLASRVGFHKPRVEARREPSPTRASSPRSEQGGSLDLLIGGICFQGIEYLSSPESSANVVGLSAGASDPTTPASVAIAIPSLRSADAVLSLVPLAPAPALAWRWWSAHADDGAGSAFPLDLLPSPALKSLARHWFVRDDHLAYLVTKPLLTVSTGPWRTKS